MNKVLLLIGIWFSVFLLSIIFFAAIDSIFYPDNKNGEGGTAYIILSFLISSAATFLIGGLM